MIESGAARLDGFQVIWRQVPKFDGRGHYGHRLAFSPDGRYLFISSGERQEFTPAQDMASNAGKVAPAQPTTARVPADNPFAAQRRRHRADLVASATATRSASPSRPTAGSGRSRWARRAATS